jgi:hypothetical protein
MYIFLYDFTTYNLCKQHIVGILQTITKITEFCVAATLDSRWKLIWSDEFTGSALDESKWTVCLSIPLPLSFSPLPFLLLFSSFRR